MKHTMRAALAIPLFWLGGCPSGERGGARFELLPPSETGITFANTITTSDSVNIQTDVYIYNGAGVAVGDIDNDGLSDIFFAGNMVSSRLYLNKGEMRFDDVTERAGVATKRWATGATMVDINDDGHLDIYVSVSGPEWSSPQDRQNLLFLNNGDRTFTEAAARYGIADPSFTTHSVFLDYDRDGCLDLFLLNNSPQDFSRAEDVRHPTGKRGDTPGSYNVLYRNDCQGKFADVSDRAGILRDAGYGLGVVVGDLNRDGWPDIYVSNDATPNDVLYVNNGDGTFTDRAARWLKHTSFAGMGVDIADYNNDTWPDILQSDMMPHSLARRKRMSGFMTYGRMLQSRGRGFRDDFSANTLQLSNGVTTRGELVFSDVAYFAGVAATDWSWSALFADLDNDGRKDIWITNGYPKAVNDLDYQTAMFALRRAGYDSASRRPGLDILAALGGYEEPNYVFRNSGDLTFADVTEAWGLEQRGFSYGAAYADLDNNGTLDLVVNNIDAPAFVYRNVTSRDGAPHYLQVRLVGDSTNIRGVGAELILTAAGQKQHAYASPYRGFMSSMDDRLHFGLGAAMRADTLEVRWPDGRRQLLTAVNGDRLVTVRQADAQRSESPALPALTRRTLMFEPLESSGLTYRHSTGAVVDYSVQPLLPYMVSRQGPPLAVGDVTGDGLDDVFVGGGGGVAGRLFIQSKDGRFTPAQAQPWDTSAASSDWGALLFDANGDRQLDLYVASGGYHSAPTSATLEDRLYINRGRGTFAKDTAALPPMLTSTSAVRAGDFTGDGRPDLFVGGRLMPRAYPLPTRSYVLRNEGGRFSDVTAEVAPELAGEKGMITDAVWVDFDGDRRLDLITVGDWMPIEFYRNEGARFRNVTQSTGVPRSRGWWYSIAAGDFDGDGDSDLVAGNFGLNHLYTTSPESRVGLYAADFTGNRTTGILLTTEIDGTEYPIAGRAQLEREIYSFGLRFRSYESFAKAPMRELFPNDELTRALHYEVDTFASLYLRNDGGGKFTSSPLPSLAQIAPIRGIIAHDVDGDGNLDLVVAGNLYDTEPNTPRADAGNGLWLRGDGRGHFAPVSPRESGFLAPLNVAALALLHTATGNAVLVANTGDSLQVFAIRRR